MLYRLEIENFYSMRDRQVLDLSIDARAPDPDGRYAPIFTGAEVRAPKVVALYGANASGKTNVLRALWFLVVMIRDSVQRADPGFPASERFNDESSKNRPMRFAIELGGAMNLSQDVIGRVARGETVEQGVYRYELEIEVVDGNMRRIWRRMVRSATPGGVATASRRMTRSSRPTPSAHQLGSPVTAIRAARVCSLHESAISLAL